MKRPRNSFAHALEKREAIPFEKTTVMMMHFMPLTM
jgi:hypothetical protein